MEKKISTVSASKHKMVCDEKLKTNRTLKNNQVISIEEGKNEYVYSILGDELLCELIKSNRCLFSGNYTEICLSPPENVRIICFENLTINGALEVKHNAVKNKKSGEVSFYEYSVPLDKKNCETIKKYRCIVIGASYREICSDQYLLKNHKINYVLGSNFKESYDIPQDLSSGAEHPKFFTHQKCKDSDTSSNVCRNPYKYETPVLGDNHLIVLSNQDIPQDLSSATERHKIFTEYVNNKISTDLCDEQYTIFRLRGYNATTPIPSISFEGNGESFLNLNFVKNSLTLCLFLYLFKRSRPVIVVRKILSSLRELTAFFSRRDFTDQNADNPSAPNPLSLDLADFNALDEFITELYALPLGLDELNPLEVDNAQLREANDDLPDSDAVLIKAANDQLPVDPHKDNGNQSKNTHRLSMISTQSTEIGSAQRSGCSQSSEENNQNEEEETMPVETRSKNNQTPLPIRAKPIISTIIEESTRPASIDDANYSFVESSVIGAESSAMPISGSCEVAAPAPMDSYEASASQQLPVSAAQRSGCSQSSEENNQNEEEETMPVEKRSTIHQTLLPRSAKSTISTIIEESTSAASIDDSNYPFGESSVIGAESSASQQSPVSAARGAEIDPDGAGLVQALSAVGTPRQSGVSRPASPRTPTTAELVLSGIKRCRVKEL
jgi:hypothetical protein